MKKLFDKNEVTFAVLLIVVYVVGSSVMQGISESVGIEYIAEMLFHIVMSVVLLVFIEKNDMMKYLGLCGSDVSAAKMWFYIPLFAVAAFPIIFGAKAQYSTAVLVCRTVSMLFVGFLEEVIFRGFLFKGICRRNIKRAVVITAITFGIGHIVNMLNGDNIFDNILQVIYAVCVGFTLVFIFYRTGSLLSCIAFHSLNNCLTGFISMKNLIGAVGNEQTASIILVAVRILIMSVYMVYVIKKIPKREQ